MANSLIAVLELLRKTVEQHPICMGLATIMLIVLTSTRYGRYLLVTCARCIFLLFSIPFMIFILTEIALLVLDASEKAGQWTLAILALPTFILTAVMIVKEIDLCTKRYLFPDRY